jgi:protease I
MHDFEPGWDTYKEMPGYVMESDLTFDQVKVGDYVAVLCLGGRAPEYLRNHPRVLEILKEFDAAEKWIFAICHGVQLGAAAGLLAGGKNVTCYEHVRLEAETCGGKYSAQKVVRDGRLVSSPTWQEHPEFYREIFNCLNGG